ncbi:MAG: D-aminoacyl-tRNA deacylase [Acidimicrobiia bacterium]|nr:MAG: D-aminoacyl-tRNA deacylase [Acidimicrobiia bacterium]
MRAVVQRVGRASVSVAGQVAGRIGPGLLALVGVGHGDDRRSAERLADLIAGLRIFPDADGKMNLAVAEVGGEVLVVSQFTLFADASRGRRPSFAGAAPPGLAEPLLGQVVASLSGRGLGVSTGRFGARMELELVNDGPVTIVLDTERRSPAEQ